MLDAVVGAVIMVVATTSMLYSIEVAERAFDQAGRYPLNFDEKEVMRNAGFNNDDSELFWRDNVLNSPRCWGEEDLCVKK
ncbi:hypothetical protein [Synechococcus sp. MU1617]|uniref:hypothetical protein n=1 Tax=Synechococcus sp. MU1617 TaxID=2508346 RepID=UPI001CF899A7|nr:hypothetical protein [Synechococcus sp. MU1617]MCB4389103.1 hypothetical protein [Synechococcus sp. MU1617]